MNLTRILAVVVARNREFYRDKAGLGWNVFTPVVMLLGFAFIFSSSDENLYRIGVLGDVGHALVSELRHVKLIEEDDETEALEKLRYHRIDLLVDVRGEPRYWVNEESASGYAAENLLIGESVTDSGLERQSVSGREVRYVDWLVPGILGLNIMFSSLWGVGWVIVRYRKNGVLRRLSATPLTASEFLIAQVLSRLLVVVSANIFVFVSTHALLDFPMRGSYIALLLVLISGAMALISIGLTVASRMRNEELADGILNMLSFPMMILCGVWFSLEGTNIWIQRIAELLPVTHIVDAARRIMLDGAGLGDVAFEVGILFATATILLVISTRAFRWQ